MLSCKRAQEIHSVIDKRTGFPRNLKAKSLQEKAQGILWAQGTLLHMSSVSIPLRGHPLLFCFLFFKTKVVNTLIKGVHTDQLVSGCLGLDVNC